MGEEYRKLVDERIGIALETGSLKTIPVSETCSGGSASDAKTSEDEDLRKLLAAARRQREIRRYILRRRAASAVAIFACIFFIIGSLYTKGFFQPEEIHAGHSPKKSVTVENGSVVIGGDGNGNAETWTATFTTYEDIPDAYQKKLVWFDYIPEGYEINKIEIKETGELLICEMILENTVSGEITIEEIRGIAENSVMVLKEYSAVSEINQIKVYLKKEKKKEYRVFYIGDMEVKIISDIEIGKKTEAMIASVRTD